MLVQFPAYCMIVGIETYSHDLSLDVLFFYLETKKKKISKPHI